MADERFLASQPMIPRLLRVIGLRCLLGPGRVKQGEQRHLWGPWSQGSTQVIGSNCFSMGNPEI